MLEVANLSVQAGSFLLSNVSLKVLPSSCHVILGPTGGGKTLLLESVIGLRNPTEGKVTLEGKDITDFPIEKRELSYVPQDLALFPHMTVRENILYPIKIRGKQQNSETGIVRELIDSFNIRHLLDRRIANLSGGERQRTALARAIVSGGKYLVLDEPLSALHESLKTELWYLLKDLQKRYDLAILMVTHDLEEAFFLGDAISVIIDGNLCQQGSKREVYQYPQSVEVANFLGIRNQFSSKIKKITGESVSLYCCELDTTLTVSREGLFIRDKNTKIATEAEFILGVRAEDIEILPLEHVEQDSCNLIKGIVQEVFENGATLTIMVLPMNSEKRVEITVPNGLYKKLNLCAKQEFHFYLPEDRIFVVNVR
ncbi:MAG: ATP-binding cassette domain-containing protein [Desulfomonilaceae bacterium]|jgi:ABC-type Fe3+/spermidine/putrescine transport system ATPase subunit